MTKALSGVYWKTFLRYLCMNIDATSMIIGIGCDIFEIKRMKEELTKSNGRPNQEIFTKQEIDYCSSRRYPEKHLAACFAAKEALFKSLSTGKTPKMSWHDIVVHNDNTDKPYLAFSGEVKAMIDKLAIRNVLLSISHADLYAMAVVVLEG